MNFEDCNLGVMAGYRKGFCTKCGTPLTGRALKWCSPDCAGWFWRNHRFTRAAEHMRLAAAVYDLAAGRVAVGLLHGYYPRPTGYTCWLCGAVGHAIEVDHHPERAWGAHAALSCLHHESNLRPLCKPCHRAASARQRRDDAEQKRVRLAS